MSQLCSMPPTRARESWPLTGSVHRTAETGFGGAFVPVNNDSFVYDMAKKNTLTISYGEGNKVIVPLEGTDAAFAALRACQDAQ